MPAGHLGTKRMGELAELAFMYRAASEGIGARGPTATAIPTIFSSSTDAAWRAYR